MNNINLLDEIYIDNDIIESRDKIYNYFYPNINQIKISIEEINNNTLYNKYGYPVIVCLKNNNNFKSYYYNKFLNQEEYNDLINSIEFIPITSYNIISGSLYKYLTTFGSTTFNKFNINDKYGNKIYKDNDVLVCSLLNFKYNNIISYLKQYNGISCFKDIYNSQLINNILGQKFNEFTTISYNRIQMINNIIESNYYSIINNCNINITAKFNMRIYKISNINEETINEEIINDNYLENITNINLDKSLLNNNDFKLSYKITSNFLIDNISNDNFNIFFDTLSNEEKYYIIMNLLVSKELCHLIINNIYILNYIIHPIFMKKYGLLIKYLLGYTWITLYIEESIKKEFIKKSDRFIFNIETASLLPYYPYLINDLHVCPYLSLLVDTESLNSKNNILGVEQFIFNTNIKHVKELTRYGICSKDNFIKRINIFASGLNEINIFNNINWDNIAITGSIIACCLPNFNSLMFHFMNEINENTTINLNEYNNTYYKDADIDIMCNIEDLNLYINKIYEFKNTIDNNLKEIYKLTDNLNITNLFSNKTVSILINKNFIKKYLNNNINKLNEISTKQIIYPLYLEWHKDNIKKNKKYDDLLIPASIDNINIIVDNKENIKKNKLDINISDELKENTNIYNDIEYKLPLECDINSDEDDNILFSPKINFKFRISSIYLKHDFEFFQIKNEDFFSVVSKFHLPIVRAYYDGLDVYITPSCISACMTLINIDYKYFAGSKHPEEILNKYRYRGFGTILNNKEIIKLVKYSLSITKWNELYELKKKNNQYNYLGLLKLDSNIFIKNINNYKFNQKKDIIYITNSLFISDKIFEYLYNINDLNILINLFSINKNGFIEPFKKWIIEYIYYINNE